MTLDEIIDAWKQDCNIDRTELGEESLKTVGLHAKYLEMYKKEKLVLIKLKEYAELHLAKYEFYALGPDEETQKLGWKLPPRGSVIKAEVPMYMEADREVIQSNLRLAVQNEKVDLLKDIIKEVQNRRWAIKYAIEWHRFTQGG